MIDFDSLHFESESVPTLRTPTFHSQRTFQTLKCDYTSSVSRPSVYDGGSILKWVTLEFRLIMHEMNRVTQKF